MPLFKNPPVESHTDTTTSPPPTTRSFFRRSQPQSPVKSPVDNHSHSQNGVERKGSMFSRYRRSSSTLSDAPSINHDNSSNHTSSLHSNFFRRTSNANHDQDPTIMAAREKVASAEALEKDADHALSQARMAVKEAREHVKILERETALDAKRARAKQLAAEDISKHALSLGRHG